MRLVIEFQYYYLSLIYLQMFCHTFQSELYRRLLNKDLRYCGRNCSREMTVLHGLDSKKMYQTLPVDLLIKGGECQVLKIGPPLKGINTKCILSTENKLVIQRCNVCKNTCPLKIVIMGNIFKGHTLVLCSDKWQGLQMYYSIRQSFQIPAKEPQNIRTSLYWRLIFSNTNVDKYDLDCWWKFCNR